MLEFERGRGARTNTSQRAEGSEQIHHTRIGASVKISHRSERPEQSHHKRAERSDQIHHKGIGAVDK